MSGVTAAWEDGAVLVRGAELPMLLAIVPVGGLDLGPDLVATIGSWERGVDVARFTPRFPAVSGTGYAVIGRPDERTHVWFELVRVDVPYADLSPRTVVDRIDPGVAEVPANLLRFSVSFSTRMEEGSAAGHVHLLDETGDELPGSLLEMPPELWDRDHRRLTILIEPGRIKRGLQPNVQAGPPLHDGGTVTLVVDSAIRDAAGAHLVAETTRSYRVGEPIRSRVDPALWQVHWSHAPSDPTVVRFDRPLDRSLVQRLLRMTDESGRPVPGRTSLDEDGQTWVFASDEVGSEHHIRIDTRLEDLAGNSVRRVFDRDLRLAADDGVDARVVVLTADGGVAYEAGRVGG